MSKTQLQSNNARLASLIEELRGKAAGGGGGGTVETCTIRIVCNTSDIFGYTYLAYDNGEFVPVNTLRSSIGISTLDVTLTDVICGGYIFVQTNIDLPFLAMNVEGGAVAEKGHTVSSGYGHCIIFAPTTAGSVSTVTIVDTD